jgi:hypothetical protein
MIIEDRSMNDLIMKLSVRKNIGLDAAKRNKDALVEYAIQKTTKKFKNIGLDCEGYTFNFSFKNDFIILELLPVINRITNAGKLSLIEKIPLSENPDIEKISNELSENIFQKIRKNYNNEGNAIKSEVASKPCELAELLGKMPFSGQSFWINIGNSSCCNCSFELEEINFRFLEPDFSKENILFYISEIINYAFLIPYKFSYMTFNGKDYGIKVSYNGTAYVNINCSGLSAQEEVDFLWLAGNAVDRVIFEGEYLKYDITQSYLLENLVDIHFEKEGKVFDIIRNKIVRQDDSDNLVIKYYKEDYTDYIDGII